MKHSVSHDLGRELARKVARAAFESYRTRFSEFSPTTDWKNDDQASIGFSVKGMSLKGAVSVGDRSIDLEMDVPFLLKPFQGKAVGIIESEIKAWIEKARRGEI